MRLPGKTFYVIKSTAHHPQMTWIHRT